MIQAIEAEISRLTGQKTSLTKGQRGFLAQAVERGEGQAEMVACIEPQLRSWAALMAKQLRLRNPDLVRLADVAKRLNLSASITKASASLSGDNAITKDRLRLAEIMRADQISAMDAIYVVLFDRAPDDAGEAFWKGQIDSGMSKAEVAAFMLDSPEMREAGFNLRAWMEGQA